MSSTYETDPNVCAKVYHSWKAARDALSQSIRSYLNACEALTSVSIDALTQSVTTSGISVPDILSAVDAELSELVLEERLLRKARVSLLESRNRSKAFSTINVFPTEILSLVFLAAKPSPTSARGTRYPTEISSVCQRWRQIALDLPSMWSYLCYIIDGPEQVNSQKCADLWSERARDAPRYVEMYQMDSGVNLDESSDTLYWSLGVQASLIQCLHLECSRLCIQSVLCCLINEGTPGSMKALKLQVDDESDGPDHILSWDSDLADEPPSSNSISDFLSSIQFLELRNTYFPWNSTAYRNLCELSLNLLMDHFSDDDCLPTQREMRSILLSSPMLHTLALKLTCSLRRRQSSVEAIRLNNLKCLTLKSHDSLGCLGLLPLIESGPNKLNVTVSVHSDPAFVKELRSFFHRSMITTLLIQPSQVNFWFRHLSRNLTDLEFLTLSGCDFRDRDLSRFFNASLISSSHASPWPKLHRLELENCHIDGGFLECLIPLNSIRTIRLYGGSNIRPQSRLKAATDAIISPMRELEQQLSAIVPDTKWLPDRSFSWL